MNTIILFFSVSLLAVGVPGWFKNLWTLITTHAALEQNEFWLRIVGIPVAIVGAIIGWF